jgi:hypothetical protein
MLALARFHVNSKTSRKWDSSFGTQSAVVFYQANRDAPIFREMHGLVNKTVGIFSVLRSALHPLAKRVLVAFVYGSECLRHSLGNQRNGSDERGIVC